ncbi:DUF2971 domain-containing protein [Tardiphaga sp. 42S5]|uniref:DUF2971 domain-containing protein n=1 Tax=Tardiphaga sp. 42S5 TaxID=1404799 RepID=UPI002A5AC290|nr:DUF2971 domain-containing protein [Tardiphaga sp. 42S5]WPO43183.1 DUF2971 domain-containing protein [Tardiphaga sp. 42S5]
MHRRAEKLADRFNQASVLRMAKGNERGAPTEPLFHYTSVAALEAIIASETFWFTSVYHMDDDQELSFGFAISHALLAAALEREDVNMKVFLKPLVEDMAFSRIRDRFEFYSASFGQKDDARQWADYADGGKGIAIGLGPKLFGLEKKKTYKPEEKTFLGKVEYGEPAAKIRHAAIVDSAVQTIKQAHQQGLLLKPEDEEAFLHLMAAYMYVEILWNSVTTKSDKWAHQVETRLLAVNDLKKPGIPIKNAPARPRVEIPQPLLKANITEVMMGPKADDDARANVRKVLDDGDLATVQITSASTA